MSNQLLVKFAKTTSDQNDYRLELDTKNEGKTTFRAGESCYIRIFPGGTRPTLSSTKGNVSLIGENVPLEVEESLVFAQSTSARLKYSLGVLLSWAWDGRGKGTPSFSGDSVFFSSKTSGVLKVKYVSYYDLAELSSDSGEGKILVEASRQDMYGYLVVNYEPKLKPVYLTVRDACARNIIPEARVFLDDVFVGLSDQSGRIFLGNLAVGRTYNLKIIKEGYQPSDQDTIANDSFTVQE